MRAQRIRLMMMLSLLLAVVLSGCSLYYNNREEAGPISGVFIDNPLDGAWIGIDQSVTVQGRVTAGPEILTIQMWLQVDEYDALPMTVEMTSQGAGGGLWFGQANWISGVPGEHQLRIRAVTDAGEEATSESITIHVSPQITPVPIQSEPTSTPPLWVTPVVPTVVLQVTPTPTPTPSPTHRPTDTPTPMPTSAAYINFWADATTVPAGTCTTIHWETAEVAGVYFDGQGVAGVDSHQVCPCASESHTLDVLLRDGSHDVRTLTINVTGYCVTPTPPRDTTPPPAPAPIGPGSLDPNQPTLICGTVVLQWNPVSDPSGIQGYRVNLQWYDGSQWQSSPPYFIVYGTSLDVTEWTAPHEYQHPLRWAVWAIDNAGNHGPQSPWLYFECSVW